MAITGSQLARITDATNISITATVAEMDELVKQAKIHSFGVAVGPQCYVPYLLQQLSGYDTKILGAAGGRATERTEDKVGMALISRAFRDSGRGHGHPYGDNARDDDFISFYDKDAVK